MRRRSERILEKVFVFFFVRDMLDVYEARLSEI